MKNILLALLGYIFLSAPLAATAQFTCITNNGTITITGYTGPGGAVTIPDVINGLPVTSIANSAFYHQPSLTGVTIPGSVTNIGLPVSYVCPSLMAITVDPANAYYSSVDGVLFNKGQTTLLECPDGKTGSYAIPASVTSIGIYAFEYCYNVTGITIPSSVASIATGTFYSCTNLTSVTMPYSVTSIGSGAFAYCFSLTGVTIPGSVTNIGGDAFFGCTRLTSITIPYSVTSIGYRPFVYCDSLMAITVDPANAYYSSVGGVLFNKSKTILIEYPGGKAGTYLIPGGVTTIGGEAFYNCSGLTGVTIPGGVTSIGHGAFTYCLGLNRVTIPGSVTNIGSDAFSDSNLELVFFEGNPPSADCSVFAGTRATVYYLPGTTGWGATFACFRAVLWNPLMQSSGVGPAGFGFNITGTADIPIVVEAARNLANATWVPLQSLNLTNGAFYFSDPNWTNYQTRIYRIRSP